MNRVGQIRRPRKKANLTNDKRIRNNVARYSSGGGTVTGVLCSVSYCCDNVTHSLSHNDDIGSSTEEYEYELESADDNAQSSATTSSNASGSVTAANTSASTSCDVCLNAPRANVALVPRGHATFGQQCVHSLTAINAHWPLCRSAISTTIQFLYSRP